VSEHIEDRLSAYLDGELPAPDRAAVEAHLAECPECSAHLAELAAVDSATRALPIEAPEGYFEAFPGKVRQRLEAQKARTWSLPHWGWAVAAAALLAVVTPLSLREGSLPRLQPEAETPVAAPQPPVASEPAGEPSGEEILREKKGRHAQDAPAGPPPDRPSRPLGREQVAPAEQVPQATPQRHKEARPAAAAWTDFATAPPPARQDAPAPAAQDTAKKPQTRTRGSAQLEDKAEAEAAPLGLVAGAASAVRREGLEEEALSAPRSAADARRLRELWRRRAEAAADPAVADAAWVRVIEFGAAAWRLGQDAEDLRTLKQDAETYLRRDRPRQSDDVHRILDALQSRE
jgi:hypothetical protein